MITIPASRLTGEVLKEMGLAGSKKLVQLVSILDGSSSRYLGERELTYVGELNNILDNGEIERMTKVHPPELFVTAHRELIKNLPGLKKYMETQ